jgi:hypothetical protein
MRYDILSKKLNNDEEFKTLVFDKTSFLPKEATNVQRLWHYLNNVYEIPNCKFCMKQVEFKIAGGIRKGYKIFCSDSCRSSYTNLNRTADKAELRKQKIKQTCLEKYGVEHYFSLDKIKSKKINSYLEKYGVDNPSKLQEIKIKKQNTCLKNYGVSNPSKSPVIHSKKTKNVSKLFVMPSGISYKVQGYEHYALNKLLELNFKENDILIGKDILDYVGEIQFSYEDKNKHYIPDIFIKSQNLFIEVKSVYWYNRDKQLNEAKKHECIKRDYNFVFWIFDKDKNITIL